MGFASLITVLSLIIGYVSAQSEFPSPCIQIGDSCYWFSQFQVPQIKYDQARFYCGQRGAHLATINGNDPVTAPLLNYFDSEGLNNAWVGATALGTQWIWDNGNTLHSTSDLWANPPNQNAGDCVEIRTQGIPNARLNNVGCRHQRYFVCEIYTFKTGTAKIPVINPARPVPTTRNPFIPLKPNF